MATTYYVNTDTGTPGGAGTSGDPFQSISQVPSGSNTLVYVDGSATDVLSASQSFIGQFIIQNPASPNNTYKLQLNFTGSMIVSNSLWQNIDIEFNANAYLLSNDLYGGATFNGCNFSALNPVSYFIQTLLSSRASQTHFNNCSFNLANMTNLESQSSVTNASSIFNYCDFYGYTQGIGSGNAIFHSISLVLNKCKFWDINGIIINQATAGSSDGYASILDSSFLVSNLTQLYNVGAFTESKLSIYGCVFSSSIPNWGGLLSSSTSDLFGILGGNCFYQTTIPANYTSYNNLTDYTDGTQTFISTTPGNADFLKPRSDSNAKENHPFNSGADIGAVQGASAVDYPALSDVRQGTVYGLGTGTLVVPSASDVRNGTAVDNTTGTLIVPAVGDVRQGTAVDAGTGTLIVPLTTQVEVGVEFDSDGSVGSAVFKEIQPGKVPLRIFTSDGSDIDGSFGPSQTFYLANGTNVDTFLASLGLSERIANGDATVIVDTENDLLKALRLER